MAKRKQAATQGAPAQNGATPAAEPAAETLDVELNWDNLTLDNLRLMMRFADMGEEDDLSPQETVALIDLLDNVVIGGAGKIRVRDLPALVDAVTSAMQGGMEKKG